MRRGQLALLKLEASPQRIRPSIRVDRWGEQEMRAQPTTAGRQEARIVLLGPNLPPQYPPRRAPAISPMRTLLARIITVTT